MKPTAGLVLSVSQLNTYVRSLLDGDSKLKSVFVAGEISNFTNHYRSGHLYMSLKDENALIRAVMFRSSAQRLLFEPSDGMKVICRGRVSLYDRDGQYQFYIEDMQPDGAGALAVAFEQLKQRLNAEGLFDSAHKKRIPFYPFKVAVITSPTGAAVQDMFNVMGRRSPATEVVLYPVAVQGENAAAQMIEAVNNASESDCDLIIIGRGGGSIEDLWAFNDEYLAKTIYKCKKPVISAVGHETDFTICDFVADMRAPTPSAAAELAVPEQAGIEAGIDDYKKRMLSAVKNRIEHAKERLDMVKNRPCFLNPETIIENEALRLDRAYEKIGNAVKLQYDQNKNRLQLAMGRLDAFNPLGILSRGYCFSRKNGKIIRLAAETEIKDILTLTFNDGSVKCKVTEKPGESD